MKKVMLKDIAFARSGDKGDVSNIGLMAFDERAYGIMRRAVSPARVKQYFGEMVKGEVLVYELPNLLALNVVLKGGLGGGATRTLRFDQTGKAMATALLRMEVEAE